MLLVTILPSLCAVDAFFVVELLLCECVVIMLVGEEDCQPHLESFDSMLARRTSSLSAAYCSGESGNGRGGMAKKLWQRTTTTRQFESNQYQNQLIR